MLFLNSSLDHKEQVLVTSKLFYVLLALASTQTSYQPLQHL